MRSERRYALVYVWPDVVNSYLIFLSVKSNTSSILISNSCAISNANQMEGAQCPNSTAQIVWRETLTICPSSVCVSPFSMRSFRTLFLKLISLHGYIVRSGTAQGFQYVTLFDHQMNN